MYSPILLLAYNRPTHLKSTLEALLQNELVEESDLIVYCDGPKDESDKIKVLEVRNILGNLSGFKSVKIIENKCNLGLAKSVINAVNYVFESYESVIVLEDDIYATKFFLKYMNAALDFYGHFESVWSISGFSYPISIKGEYKYDTYYYGRSSSKGWGTWKKIWTNVDFDEKSMINKWGLSEIKYSTAKYGKDISKMLDRQIGGSIDSWAIRFLINQIMSGGKTVYPKKSYVVDIGDDYGTHASDSIPHKLILADGYSANFCRYPDKRYEASLASYIKFYTMKSKLKRVLDLLRINSNLILGR